MRAKLVLALTIMIIMLNSCVVMYPQVKQSKKKTTNSDTIDLELVQAQLPTMSQFNIRNSLQITTINYKAKMIAETNLLGDTLLRGEPGLVFRITLRNFDKTEILSTNISCKLSAFDNLNIKKTEGGHYQLINSDDLKRPTFLLDTKVESDKSELVYTFSGQLVTESGSKVNYWAISDVVGFKIMLGSAILTSHLIDLKDYVFNICNERNAIANAKRDRECKTPLLKIEYRTFPLANIFYKEFVKDFYMDCSAHFICPK